MGLGNSVIDLHTSTAACRRADSLSLILFVLAPSRNCCRSACSLLHRFKSPEKTRHQRRHDGNAFQTPMLLESSLLIGVRDHRHLQAAQITSSRHHILHPVGICFIPYVCTGTYMYPRPPVAFLWAFCSDVTVRTRGPYLLSIRTCSAASSAHDVDQGRSWAVGSTSQADQAA